MNERIIESSGEVFADLGFPHEEAALLPMRAESIATLRQAIEGYGWTQQQVAEVLPASPAGLAGVLQRLRL
ncbi:XRE family transcriptional regulator [Pseudoduganella sp. LjRoot289]|uniref:hypothetical protein n=1 Tax=Pseudoduganella sp. LjRoot289 TaxID=3342314 RepID=UPI003ECD6EB2